VKQTLFAAVLLAATAAAVAQTRSSLRDSQNPQFQAEIVSTDAAGKTITVQKAAPAPMKAAMKPRTSGTASNGSTDTAPAVVLKVDDNVATVLESFKPGDKVILTCQAAAPSGTTPATKGPLAKCAVVTGIVKS
jgi:hypothetical protein